MARIYTPITTLTTSPVGQLRLISNAFGDLKGGTVKEITEHVIKGGLVTKQDPTRVVMFYMIHLSKIGKVKEITETELSALRGNGKSVIAAISDAMTKAQTAKTPVKVILPKNTATKKSSPKTARR